MRVAFQGEPGAYSEEAIAAYFGPSAAPVGCPRFSDVFAALAAREVDRALVPFENSLAGLVPQPHDLLFASGLCIVGEHLLRIRHCLLGLPGERLEQVKQVRSHPQALAQCGAFIAQHQLLEVPHQDTAGSARQLAEEQTRGVAVIASAGAGERYGLQLLASGIETSTDNETRFLDLAFAPASGEGSKTALALTFKEGVGALPGALALLERHGLRLTRLVERPAPGQAWSWVFFLDLAAGRRACAPAIVALRESGASVRELGSFQGQRF